MGYAPLDAKRINDKSYLQAKMRLLKSVHFIDLDTKKGDTVFYIQAPSKMNNVKC
jgi:hypothetical protein